MPRALAAALFALAALLAALPAPALAVGVLSNGTVTPTSGTTATSFTFTVDYASTDNRPAQDVWAQVGGTTVTLVKVSGSSHDGTWQGTSTLPAGTWTVTFNASTSGTEQPAPYPGPVITVSTPPPTPTPTATPRPTPMPTPRPTPTPPPGSTPAPPPPIQTTPPAPPTTPAPESTPRDRDRPTASPEATPSATADGSGSTVSIGPSPSGTDADPAATPGPTEPAIDDTSAEGGGFLSMLVVGGTMSVVGAAVLARQWVVTRAARPR